MTYSRRWLKLVGDELRAEVQDTLLKRVVHGMECQISVLGQVKDANKDALWLNVFIKEKPVEDDEAAPDPPTMHMIFLCADHGCAFYISGYSPNKQGDRYRAIALDVEALRQGHVKPPSRLPPLKVKCVELASAMTALRARVRAHEHQEARPVPCAGADDERHVRRAVALGAAGKGRRQREGAAEAAEPGAADGAREARRRHRDRAGAAGHRQVALHHCGVPVARAQGGADPRVHGDEQGDRRAGGEV